MKTRKTLAVMGVLLASFMGASLVACAGSDKPNPEQPQGKEYTVTFDANGGTLTGNSTVKVKEGEKITGAPTAAKAEHTFEAWYDAATDGVKIALNTYTVSKDVTLYAHYTPNPVVSDVKITFDANGGKFAGDKSTVEKTPDADNLVLDLDDPTQENHRFLGWFTAKTGGEAVDPMFDELTESQTLYAQWVRQYTITFNPGGGTLTGSASVKIDEGEKITGAPTANKAGNDFYGWYTAATEGEKIDLDTYTVGGDATLYAQFGEYTMPLKVLKDKEGTAVGYRIEAETSKVLGETNSENSAGTGFIENNQATASGNSSIGYFGKAGNTMTYTFKAATTGKATLTLMASSAKIFFSWEGGMMTMYPEDQIVNSSLIKVEVNNQNIPFEAATLRGSYENYVFNKYWDPISLGEVDLVAGTNTLVVTVVGDSAPNFDYLDIQTAVVLTSVSGDAASGEATMPEPPAPDVVYEKAVTGKLIVVDHAEGPAIQKAVLAFADDITAATLAENPFKVGSVGKKETDKVYLSDADGNKVADGTTSARYVTIEYKYELSGGYAANGVKPFTYNQQTGRNTWNTVSSYALTVKGLTIGETTYTKFGGTFTAEYVVPELEKWDTDGTFTDGEGDSAITLKYASFAPVADAAKTGKKPLIVWLHGAGEGGTDPSIALLGNQVVNLGKQMIQKYFTTDTVAGAYVLAPQSPTMWMDNGNGQQGGSDVGESIYTESLFKLIEKFVTDHTDIDANRVYIGGCSNGGWMTIEMLSKHGEFFAAAYPIAVPFVKDAGMTTDEFNKLVNVPMWITHAKADNTVKINEITQDWSHWPNVTTTIGAATETNSNQLYIELLKAGATNVHYSLFEKVTVAAGEDAATYDGHYSWIFTLRDECSKVQATKGTGENGAFVLADLDANSTATVEVEGEAVTLWGWLAAQAKTTPAA